MEISVLLLEQQPQKYGQNPALFETAEERKASRSDAWLAHEGHDANGAELEHASDLVSELPTELTSSFRGDGQGGSKQAATAKSSAFATAKHSRFSSAGSYMKQGKGERYTMDNLKLEKKFGILMKRDRMARQGGVWKERRVVLTHSSKLLWLVQPGEMGAGPNKDVKVTKILKKAT